MMRLSTALSLLCWTKRVISPAWIEKLCQLMMVFGVFVIEKILPCWLKLACAADHLRQGGVGLRGAETAGQQQRQHRAAQRRKGRRQDESGGVRDWLCMVFILILVGQGEAEMQAVGAPLSRVAAIDDMGVIELQIGVAAQQQTQAQAAAADALRRAFAGQHLVAACQAVS